MAKNKNKNKNTNNKPKSPSNLKLLKLYELGDYARTREEALKSPEENFSAQVLLATALDPKVYFVTSAVFLFFIIAVFLSVN